MKSYREIIQRAFELVDPRPVIFFRLSFAYLMIIYSTGRCTDFIFKLEAERSENLNFVLNSEVYSISSERTPFPLNLIHDFILSYPWLLRPELKNIYWNALHSPLLLITSSGMLFSYGSISRFFYISFGFLKLVSCFRDITRYNNHEYLYSSIAILLGVIEVHAYDCSVPGIVNKSKDNYLSICILGLYSLIYMMFNNAMHGIAHHVAILGMSTIWIALILLLGRPSKPKGKKASGLMCKGDVWLFQLLFSAVYLHAALAKLDWDWISGSTVRDLFRIWANPAFRLFGSDHVNSFALRAVSYGGICIDTLAGIALPFSNTNSKKIIVIFIFLFHVSNHYMFVIETFPWVMLSSCSIYFDHHWIENLYNLLALKRKSDDKQLSDSKPVRNKNVKNRRNISPSLSPFPYKLNSKFLISCLINSLSSSILYLNVISPFQCNNPFQSSTQKNWYSTCQFFMWRMMTRSVQVKSFHFRLVNPKSKRISLVDPKSLGFKEPEIGYYEDLVSKVAVKIGTMAIPNPEYSNQRERDNEKPIVYTDLWLEINGPPVQRYVHPRVDLFKKENVILDDISTMKKVWNFWNSEVKPLASWVQPRIPIFRSDYWTKRMESTRKYIEENWTIENGSLNSKNIFFLAEDQNVQPTSLFFPNATNIILLYGEAYVKGFGVMKPGDCFSVLGTFTWIKTGDSISPPVLWAIDSRRSSISEMKFYDPNQLFDMDRDLINSTDFYSSSSNGAIFSSISSGCSLLF